MKLEDLTGRTFGRWVVAAYAEKRGEYHYWMCRCACGVERAVQGAALRGGKTRSCGCWQPELARDSLSTHGLTRTAGYKSWLSMRQRCGNPKDAGFKAYGGRGIRVCERWQTFENFWADMGAGWFPKATIERRDVNGHYEPENCIWAPKSQQAKNRRCTPFIETPWGRLSIPEAAKRIGLSPTQMSVRYRKGWRGEKLLSPPAEKGARISPRSKGR